MKSRIAIGLAVASFAVLGLTACSSDSGGSKTSAPATTTSAGAQAPAAGAALATATTSLGTIVVDGKGMTVYEYASDTQGGDSSTCTGACASNWPAVPGSAAPQLDGVTGAVATITGADGKLQLTLNGWPLYYYAGDKAAGDTTGQGVGNVWWVLTPAGELIK